MVTNIQPSNKHNCVYSSASLFLSAQHISVSPHPTRYKPGRKGKVRGRDKGKTVLTPLFSQWTPPRMFYVVIMNQILSLASMPMTCFHGLSLCKSCGTIFKFFYNIPQWDELSSYSTPPPQLSSLFCPLPSANPFKGIKKSCFS